MNMNIFNLFKIFYMSLKKKKSVPIGKRFNRLIILKEVATKKNHRRVLVKCDCGVQKEVNLCDLKSGYTQSCGCLQKELRTTHGLRRTHFYYIFQNILQRCNNEKNTAYKNYGDRGIKNEWKNFEEFKNDMYESYLKHCKEFGRENTSIDRLDNNGNYNKENCSFATMAEQSNNRRNNRFITFNGETLTIAQWARRMKLKTGFIHYRLINNISIEKILTI